MNLLELMGQYVNYSPLLASMRDRYNKLSQELLHVRDPELHADLTDAVIKTAAQIDKFEKKGKQILERLGKVKLSYSGGEVTSLEAVSKAETIKAEAEQLGQLAATMRGNTLLGHVAKEVADLIELEAKRKELQLTELTSSMLTVQVRRNDYSDIQLLWNPHDIGAKIIIEWDILNACWPVPVELKPNGAFKKLLSQLSGIHRPNAQVGDTLYVEGYPLEEDKWRFKTRIQRADTGPGVICFSST